MDSIRASRTTEITDEIVFRKYIRQKVTAILLFQFGKKERIYERICLTIEITAEIIGWGCYSYRFIIIFA